MTIDLEEDSKDMHAQARRWVVRLHSGEPIGTEEHAALESWQQRSSEHRRALAEAQRRWNVMQVAIKAGNFAKAGYPQAYRQHGLNRRAYLGGALAASVAGAGFFAARPPLGLWPSLAELGADYRTGVGERRQIVVPSGASIEMNTRTSLIVPKSGVGPPQIELVVGEIAITTDMRHVDVPLVVVAGNGKTSAGRATFDLRHDGEDVTVTCLEGAVRVECGSDHVRLGARQRVGYGPGGLGSVIETDERAIGAWRRGLLVFENQPLSTVIPEINRYRRGRIVLMSDAIGRLPLDATFRLDRIDEVVPKIAHIFDLKVRTLPGGIVLLG
jgi:transmembrane sensor